MWTREKDPLGDVRQLLDYLGNPDRDRPAIHVVGINGKGFVCASLTSILEEAGYNTGIFTSSHLVEVRERFLINGRMVDQESFEGAFETVLEASRKLVDQRLCRPTFFKFLFYMVMVLFRMRDVDVMILETDMGGRLDTANVLERPAACVTTSTNTDRTKHLGDTPARIAREKASITRTGVPLISDDGQPEVSTIPEGFAFRRGAARCSVGQDDFHVEEISKKSLSINAGMKNDRCLELEISLEAFYQVENAMLAVRILDVLCHPGECSRTECRMPGHGPYIHPDEIERGMSDQHIVEDLGNTFWPGCMEQVRSGICLDGAHNPGSIEVFIQTVGGISDRQGRKP